MALAVASPGAISGCDPVTYAQGDGYVRSYVGTFEPRELVVVFVAAGFVEANADALVAASHATTLSKDLGSYTYLVETELGYGLQEVADLFDLDAQVESCSPNPLVYAETFGSHMLANEDALADRCWLRGDAAELQSVAYEFSVRVRGLYEGEASPGIGIMDVTSVEILGERIVQKGGTVTVVDRGGGDLAVILVDALREEAWELTGTVAAAMTGLGGSLVSVHGAELLPNLDSRAGGLELRATSYDEITNESDVRTLMGTALATLTYDAGSDIWFLPVELAPGALVRPPGLTAAAVDTNGYLLLIDEDPGAAWPHTARIVFVDSASPATPNVLFVDVPAASLEVRDASGERVSGPWVLY